MNITWNYKIDLVDEGVFAEIESERGIAIPDELKDVVIAGNAATPEKYNFMIGSTEKVLGAILSFNKDEQDTDTVYTALEVIEDKNLFPFAIDSFGNYICMDLEKEEVVFWDHESSNVYSTEKDLESFMDSLY